MAEPILVAGLGNPGPKYRFTRHNAGWMLVDRLAAALGIETWRNRFKGLYAEAALPEDWAGRMGPAGTRLILFKPAGFMNTSGGPIQMLLDYYSCPRDRMIIAVDDINLPLGRIRIRPNGSAGGHNGLKDVERRLGTREYNRVRIGVGAPRNGSLTGHVLGTFSREELETLSNALDLACECVVFWMKESMAKAMTQFNRRLESKPDSTGSNIE